MTDILIGTDPELFVRHPDKGFISAHDLVPGSKEQPHLVRQGAVQPDGVAAEFNTFPAETEDEFVDNHSIVLSELLKIVRKNGGDSLELVPVPSVRFDKDYWDSLPPEPKRLGCQPDYNAYTGKIQSPPGANIPFRTGGFHIHVGWGSNFNPNDKKHIEKCCKVARQLDAVIYGVSMLWDNDQSRRKLYGAMGSFRPKLYGMEWRPLSNAALQDERILRWLFSASIAATRLLFEKEIELVYQEFQNPVESNEFYQEYGIPAIPQFLTEEILKEAA